MSSDSDGESRTEIEQDADAFAAIINGNYRNEEDRIILCNMLMSRVITTTSVTKVQAHGVPELIACQYIGLKWNGKTVHGDDAVDDRIRSVELKTYKRVKDRRNVNIMYPLSAPLPGEDDDARRKRIVHDFLTNKKYEGGHYWVSFNQTKQKVLHYNFVETATVGKLIDDYLKANPDSRMKNFGGTLCKHCRRCHSVDEISKLYSKDESVKPCKQIK